MKINIAMHKNSNNNSPSAKYSKYTRFSTAGSNQNTPLMSPSNNNKRCMNVKQIRSFFDNFQNLVNIKMQRQSLRQTNCRRKLQTQFNETNDKRQKIQLKQKDKSNILDISDYLSKLQTKIKQYKKDKATKLDKKSSCIQIADSQRKAHNKHNKENILINSNQNKNILNIKVKSNRKPGFISCKNITINLKQHKQNKNDFNSCRTQSTDPYCFKNILNYQQQIQQSKQRIFKIKQELKNIQLLKKSSRTIKLKIR